MSQYSKYYDFCLCETFLERFICWWMYEWMEMMEEIENFSILPDYLFIICVNPSWLLAREHSVCLCLFQFSVCVLPYQNLLSVTYIYIREEPGELQINSTIKHQRWRYVVANVVHKKRLNCTDADKGYQAFCYFFIAFNGWAIRGNWKCISRTLWKPHSLSERNPRTQSDYLAIILSVQQFRKAVVLLFAVTIFIHLEFIHMGETQLWACKEKIIP